MKKVLLALLVLSTNAFAQSGPQKFLEEVKTYGRVDLFGTDQNNKPCGTRVSYDDSITSSRKDSAPGFRMTYYVPSYQMSGSIGLQEQDMSIGFRSISVSERAFLDSAHVKIYFDKNGDITKTKEVYNRHFITVSKTICKIEQVEFAN